MDPFILLRYDINWSDLIFRLFIITALLITTVFASAAYLILSRPSTTTTTTTTTTAVDTNTSLEELAQEMEPHRCDTAFLIILVPTLLVSYPIISPSSLFSSIFTIISLFVLSHPLFLTSVYIQHRLNTFGSVYTRGDIARLLPRFMYEDKKLSTSDVIGSRELCVVCWDSYEDGEWCRILPECKHMFHQGCVDGWLFEVPHCPICRTHVRLNKFDLFRVWSRTNWRRGRC